MQIKLKSVSSADQSMGVQPDPVSQYMGCAKGRWWVGVLEKPGAFSVTNYKFCSAKIVVPRYKYG